MSSLFSSRVPRTLTEHEHKIVLSIVYLFLSHYTDTVSVDIVVHVVVSQLCIFLSLITASYRMLDSNSLLIQFKGEKLVPPPFGTKGCALSVCGHSH